MSNKHVHPLIGEILRTFRGEKIITNFDYPPIPIRSWDWSAHLDGYDGAPDAGWQPVGHGETEAEAIADLKREIEDHDDV